MDDKLLKEKLKAARVTEKPSGEFDRIYLEINRQKRNKTIFIRSSLGLALVASLLFVLNTSSVQDLTPINYALLESQTSLEDSEETVVSDYLNLMNQI